MKLIDFLKRENNNLDLIRVFAAILVIWNHSFALSPSVGIKSRAIVGIAVPLFGFISGLVITNSILNKNNGLKFIVSTFARIWCPLLVTVCFCAFIVGPYFSEHGAYRYFTEYTEGIQIYIYKNLKFQIVYNLPGVFVHNRYANAVNGSIWVLPIFIGSYMFFLALKLFGVLKESPKSFYTIILIMCACVGFKLFNINLIRLDDGSFYLIMAILFGSALCCLRRDLEVNLKLVVGSILLFLIFRGTYINYAMKLLVVFMAALYIAGNEYFLKLKPGINISLGLFLYSFPIQQSVSCLLPKSSPYVNFAIAIPLTVLFSIFSSKYLEKNCYKLADKINEFIDKNKLKL